MAFVKGFWYQATHGRVLGAERTIIQVVPKSNAQLAGICRIEAQDDRGRVIVSRRVELQNGAIAGIEEDDYRRACRKRYRQVREIPWDPPIQSAPGFPVSRNVWFQCVGRRFWETTYAEFYRRDVPSPFRESLWTSTTITVEREIFLWVLAFAFVERMKERRKDFSAARLLNTPFGAGHHFQISGSGYQIFSSAPVAVPS